MMRARSADGGHSFLGRGFEPYLENGKLSSSPWNIVIESEPASARQGGLCVYKEFQKMRSHLLTIVALFVGLASMASTAIHAATICVDPGKPSCEATVQDGVDAAAAGDTVSIAKGDFYEAVVVPAGKDGLIIKGKGNRTVIDSATTGLSGIDVSSANVSISRLTVRNADSNGIVIQTGADGVEIARVRIQNADSDCIETDGHDTVIEKNTLVACGSYMVDVDADDVVIERNTMKHADSGGIQVDGERALVEKNKISVVEDGDCIDVDGGYAEIVRNTATNCDSDGVYVYGDAPYVAKNRVVGAHGYDVYCTGDCASGAVSGNRSSDTGEDEGGFEIDADVDGLLVDRNRVEDSNDEAFDISGSGMITAEKNIARNIGGDNYESCYEINGTGGHMLERNSCDSTPENGFRIDGGDGHTIHRNKVVDAFEDGIDVDGTATSVTITRNKVSAGASGIEVAVGATGDVSDNKVSGGRVDFCDESAGGVTTSGNDFDTTDVAPCASDVD